MRITIILFFFFVHSLSSHGEVRLPKIFNDNMVLQRDQKIAVWGWADANEQINVQFNKQHATTTADKNGNWSIRLNPEKAGGPFQLTVAGKNQIILKNILVGDVWVCSGQSNMEWTLRDTDGAIDEIKQANYPRIRHIKVRRAMAGQPQTDITNGTWTTCSPETAGNFTAVGYYFAKQLFTELDIPIGLVNTTWGGTNSETWTSREAFESSDEFKSMIATLPKLNLDSVTRQRKENLKKSIVQFQGKRDTPEQISHWKEKDFDDASWPKLKVPALWSGPLLENFDGTIWLRKTFTIDASLENHKGMLELGMIDDSDETFVNGVKVGETKNKYNVKRIYNIPASLLKAGINTVAVRVEDTGGGGGIYGNNEQVKLTLGNTMIPLAGEWSAQIEQPLVNVSISPNSYPSLLYNAMVNPLISFSIKGIIWYQGETNADHARQYNIAFPLLINDWRKKWNKDDLPFYFVQLSSFNEHNGNSVKGSTWAELREAQKNTLSLPYTGMAVTTDIGNPNDIHPRNKEDVGKRLAAQALAKTYHKNIVYEGPVYQSMKIEGNKIIISFSAIGGGLMTNDKSNDVNGFEIAGADGKFYQAEAKISDDKKEVIVWHESVRLPRYVRFGWADDASADNLFNEEGFPAGPFRTDSLRGITDDIKYKFAE